PDSCDPTSVTVTTTSAAEVSAVYMPSGVIVPAEAAQVTAIATLSPATVRPEAANGCVCAGSSTTLSGATRICTTVGLGYGRLGSSQATMRANATNVRCRRESGMAISPGGFALSSVLGGERTPWGQPTPVT